MRLKYLSSILLCAALSACGSGGSGDGGADNGLGADNGNNGGGGEQVRDTPAPAPTPVARSWEVPASASDANLVFVVSDPLTLRDAHFCAEYGAFNLTDAVMADRNTCMTAYQPQPFAALDTIGNPLALNWNGVCSTVGQSLLCGLRVALPQGHGDNLTSFEPSELETACGPAQYDIYHKSTNVRFCLNWTQAIAFIRDM